MLECFHDLFRTAAGSGHQGVLAGGLQDCRLTAYAGRLPSEVASAFALPGASGAVAVQGESIAGFVPGIPRPARCRVRKSESMRAGHAAAEMELVRDMYGLAAVRWV